MTRRDVGPVILPYRVLPLSYGTCRTSVTPFSSLLFRSVTAPGRALSVYVPYTGLRQSPLRLRFLTVCTCSCPVFVCHVQSETVYLMRPTRKCTVLVLSGLRCWFDFVSPCREWWTPSPSGRISSSDATLDIDFLAFRRFPRNYFFSVHAGNVNHVD